MGAHDDRRVSLFEEQQSTYRLLQDVFVGQEDRADWALGVAEEAKARALHVIRTAPSLRVARQAADKMHEHGSCFQVDLHVTTGATKRRVSHDLKGVGWAHFSCHADEDTQSLLLLRATPHVSTMGADDWARMKYLSMKDVETDVEMAVGSTAVLSACDSGLGEIKAEVVIGLARGFL